MSDLLTPDTGLEKVMKSTSKLAGAMLLMASSAAFAATPGTAQPGAKPAAHVATPAATPAAAPAAAAPAGTHAKAVKLQPSKKDAVAKASTAKAHQKASKHA